MFLGSNICCVSSGTVTARNECAPRLVSGANPTMKKWRRGKGNHVDGQLAEIRVQLAREAQTRSDARHDGGDEVVEIAVRRVRQLQGAHADVVESLVVDAEGLVRVLHQLVDRQRGVVGLHHRVRHLGRRHDREGGHHAVGELLADLGDEQSAHAGAGAAAERVRDLEPLQAVAALGLAADHVEDLVDELGALGVVALGPVVAGARLAEDKVVRAEQLAEGAGADGSMVPGSRSTSTARGTYLLPEACIATTTLGHVQHRAIYAQLSIDVPR